MLVAEQDIERIGVLRKVSASFEEPPEGYEPILHIRIPIDVDISDLKERGIVRIHYNGKPEIIDKDTKIDVDDKLMQFLSKPFPPQGNWAYLRFDGAQLDCSARMLLTYHKDLLDTMLTELDITRKRRAKLYLINLIKLHDGDFHLKTLIDPRKKTGDAVFYPSKFVHNPDDKLLSLSVYWHELWAIVNEMRVLDGVKDEISEFVKKKVEGARKASGVRLYSMIYEIIRFFQNKGLTLDDMIEILKVPTEVAVDPDNWLCCVLLDLAEGLDPTQIPYESLYYKLVGIEYDILIEKLKMARKKILRSPLTRIDQSMYEVIVIGDEAIERKWFCLKPKPDIAEVVLKVQIFLQEFFKMQSDLIPTTLRPTNFLWLEYQERELSIEDLFRDAMNAEISPERLKLLFTLNHVQAIQESVIGKAVIKTFRRMGISDLDDYARWLGFKNWDDFERWNNSVMEIEDDF